jgi:hypothetical protein
LEAIQDSLSVAAVAAVARDLDLMKLGSLLLDLVICAVTWREGIVGIAVLKDWSAVIQSWRAGPGFPVAVNFEVELDAIQAVVFSPVVAAQDHNHNLLHCPSRRLRNLRVWLLPISW